MRVLDLFSGLGGWAAPFRERGHEVITVDIEERFGCDLTMDVLDLTRSDLPWSPDIILASPPCETFSIMTFGHYWLPGYQPKNDRTLLGVRLVKRTVELIEDLAPVFWVVENPLGMLRKLHLLPYERLTVNYCQYGTPYMKPTDLWGGFPPSWVPRRRCKNNASCHVESPRGSTTGIQGGGAAVNQPARLGFRGGMIEDMRKLASQSQARKDLSAQRAIVPPGLSLEICLAAERDLAAGLTASDYSGRLFA